MHMAFGAFACCSSQNCSNHRVNNYSHASAATLLCTCREYRRQDQAQRLLRAWDVSLSPNSVVMRCQSSKLRTCRCAVSAVASRLKTCREYPMLSSVSPLNPRRKGAEILTIFFCNFSFTTRGDVFFSFLTQSLKTRKPTCVRRHLFFKTRKPTFHLVFSGHTQNQDLL